MADGPINPDREQQRRDNIVSRRQSGLEPRPQDLEAGPAEAEERKAEERKAEERKAEERGADESSDGKGDRR